MCIRVLIIGFGFMGQTHTGNILKHPNAKLVGIVDSFCPQERLKTIRGNRATVAITADDIAGVPFYTDTADALQRSNADAVIIALPTKLHYASVMAALECGKHVMVEKPFAIEMAECIQMAAKAKTQDKVLAVGYVVRHMREYELLKEMVETQRLGKLNYMSLTRYAGVPAWGNWRDPEFVKTSGGALFDLVSHDIDFMRHCLGEPEKVEPNLSLCQEMNGNLIAAVFHYKDCKVFIHGGFVTPSNFPFQCNYTAYFENGTIASDGNGVVKEYTVDGEVKVMDNLIKDPYYAEDDAFLNAVESGDVSAICTGEDAVRTIQCCHTLRAQL